MITLVFQRAFVENSPYTYLITRKAQNITFLNFIGINSYEGVSVLVVA